MEKMELFGFMNHEELYAALPDIDRLFAESFSDQCDEKIFYAFLFSASRKGHLHITVQNASIFPKIQDLFPEINGIELLEENVIKGSQGKLADNIVKQGEKFYLQRLFRAEQRCFTEWLRLKKGSILEIDERKLNEILSQLAFEGLNQKQLEAIKQSFLENTTILTGGPGTGKTFTAGKFLQTLFELHAGELEIAIAAPTGKATLNLQLSLLKQGFSKPLQAKTLHSLLGLNSQRRAEDRPILPFDVVIVDEASMIDVELMSELLAALKTGAKLLLMGDPFQLPPVDCAGILKELIALNMTHVELQQCMRAERYELVSLAQQVKEGLIPTAHKITHAKELLTSLLDQFFPKNTAFDNPDTFIKHVQTIILLSPMRKGPIGTETLNRWILNNRPAAGLMALPIMITANDYRLELFNGEIGIALVQSEKFNGVFLQEDWIYFPSGRKIPAILLSRYEIAFALTVHKSQGSEFDHVYLLLQENQKPSKELLYTAVTRAKKNVQVYEVSSL